MQILNSKSNFTAFVIGLVTLILAYCIGKSVSQPTHQLLLPTDVAHNCYLLGVPVKILQFSHASRALNKKNVIVYLQNFIVQFESGAKNTVPFDRLKCANFTPTKPSKAILKAGFSI